MTNRSLGDACSSLQRLMERAGAADRTRFAAIATHRDWVDPDWFRLDA